MCGSTRMRQLNRRRMCAFHEPQKEGKVRLTTPSPPPTFRRLTPLQILHLHHFWAFHWQGQTDSGLRCFKWSGNSASERRRSIARSGISGGRVFICAWRFVVLQIRPCVQRGDGNEWRQKVCPSPEHAGARSRAHTAQARTSTLHTPLNACGSGACRRRPSGGDTLPRPVA